MLGRETPLKVYGNVKPTTVRKLGESCVFSKNSLQIAFVCVAEGQISLLKCDIKSASIFVKPTTVRKLVESCFFSKNSLLIPFFAEVSDKFVHENAT